MGGILRWMEKGGWEKTRGGEWRDGGWERVCRGIRVFGFRGFRIIDKLGKGKAVRWCRGGSVDGRGWAVETERLGFGVN